MLRVMKQKALESSLDGEEKQEDQITDPSRSHESTMSEVMVSHVPVSVGSRTCPSSANSSISSKGANNAEAESSRIDNEASVSIPLMVDGGAAIEDSPTESPAVATIVEANKTERIDGVNGVSVSPIKKNVRMVSVEDGNPQSPTKKPRTDTGPLHVAVLPIAPAPSALMLLTREEDEAVLSPLHVFVRQQIEVFTATPAELAQPAPGRKNPIKLNQVGLRCIHCRHLPIRKRVKRAVCYPSSVGRVYHSVSDFKFDHMSSCRELPKEIRDRFEVLKAQGKKSNDRKPGFKNFNYSSSTSQYYHDAALLMGMTDGPGGIFMTSLECNSSTQMLSAQSNIAPKAPLHPSSLPQTRSLPIHGFGTVENLPVPNMHSMLISAMKRNSSLEKDDGTLHKTHSTNEVAVTLSSPEDSEYLNKLHCFVRRHLEIFTADKGDLAAPAPGRKTRIQLGQVGIRCVHCARLPIKDRVKRAVCYPPSVAGIYHAVSNMKHDHFAICRGLPAKAREEFETFKSLCTRRGTAGNGSTVGSRSGMVSSTAQYYLDSAIRMGLVDTETGIRFGNVNPKQETNSVRREASTPSRITGMSALMMAASQAA